MEDKVWRQSTVKVRGTYFSPRDDKVLPVETHSFCRLARSLRCWSFKSSGAVHTTSDTVALVLLSHDINHLARQSHSKALPRRSLRENKRQEVAKGPHNRKKDVCHTDTTYSSMRESKSMKMSLGRNLMLLFAKDLMAKTNI